MGRVLILVILCLPAGAAAQSVDAVVKGTVRDQVGAVVAGARVTAENPATGLVRSAVSDPAGRYHLPPVPAGTYTLTAVAAGFPPRLITHTLLVGSEVTVNFSFDTVTLAHAVDVVAAAPMLETTRNSLSRHVAKDEIDALPVVDRNFNALASLAPGVTSTGVYGGVDIGGSRDFQNGYNVDGVSAEGTGAGDQRVKYSQDWIQEFQVLTSQYAVEFGRASGGILNVITRSGSNGRASRAYSFFRDEAWDATPAFATSKAPLASKRLGGTSGGKLVVDRLFYFAGIEWLDDASTRIVNSSFAELNGPAAATTDQKVLLAKVDHYVDDSNSYRGRYNHESRGSTNVNVGGITTEQHGLSLDYRAHDAAASWTRIISSLAVNELRAALTTTESDSACNFARQNPSDTWFGVVYPAARLRCPAGFGRSETSELQLIDNVSWSRGGHDLKAGLQASRVRSFGDFRFLRDGFYSFRTPRRFDIAVPDTYPMVFNRFDGATVWDVSRWSSGLFVQDSWRIRRDVTVNGGLRYDLDGSYTALNPLLRTDKALRTVSLDVDNLAPRVGVAWTPFDNDGRTLLRAGAGVFYDENHGNVTTLILFNSALVQRAVTIDAEVASLNPFGADVAAARRLLADALARNTVPDLAFGGTADLDPHLQVPFSLQASAGIAHDFGRGMRLSADAVIADGRQQYSIGDVNLDRASALRGEVVRLNPNYTFINQYTNGGWYRYRALQMQASVVPGARRFLKVSYTLADTESNTRTVLEGIGGGAGGTNPFDLDEDRGPADQDIRHVLSVNGVSALPFGLQGAAILSARSALPWSVPPRRIDTDVFLDRDEPRNSRRGDSYVSLDMRLSRVFRAGTRTTVMALAEVFNLTNETNLTGYVMPRGATVAQPTAATERRRVQFGIRVEF